MFINLFPCSSQLFRTRSDEKVLGKIIVKYCLLWEFQIYFHPLSLEKHMNTWPTNELKHWKQRTRRHKIPLHVPNECEKALKLLFSYFFSRATKPLSLKHWITNRLKQLQQRERNVFFHTKLSLWQPWWGILQWLW